MFGGGGRWLRFSERFKFLATNAKTSSFCTSAKNGNNKNNNIYDTNERYRQLQNLDMMTAAKILFTDPPKKEKFGFDFHLVQFFFACLPSLGVYLVAQYARYEMRKMEVEVEQKRKQKEEEEAKEKEKEMELNPPEEKEEKSDLQLSEVKVRLEKLEEAVKEIVVETKKPSSSNLAKNQRLEKLEEAVKEVVVEIKKPSSSNLAKNQVADDEKKGLNSSAPQDTSTTDSASNKTVDENHFGKHNSPKSKPESSADSLG